MGGLVAIAATIVLPKVSANNDAIARRTAEAIAQTIAFVRDESLRTQRPHLFRLNGTIVEAVAPNSALPSAAASQSTVSTPGAILTNPSNRQPYSWDATSVPGAAGTSITARFLTSDGQIRTQIYFDADGLPKYIDATGHHLLKDGEVIISVGLRTYKVLVAPVTGRVNVEPN